MDEDGSRLWWAFLCFIALTLIQLWIGTALSAAEEIAPRLKKLTEKNSSFQVLLNLRKRRPYCLTRTWITERLIYDGIGILLLVYIGKGLLYPLFAEWVSQTLSIVLTYGITIFAGVFLTGLFGTFLPERIVQKTPQTAETLAKKQCRWIVGIVYFLLPLSSAFRTTAALLSRSPIRETPEAVTEEDILLLVNAGNETGSIEEQQREMINNIFEFDDMLISEVMTHRTDLIAVDVEMKINDVVCLARDENYSRMPVYQESIDNIIGILNVKDLLGLIGCRDITGFHVRHFMREALFVPETAKCDDVLSEMSRKKMQMAIVIDEYGGTAGIVSMEDILEEIVGNIQDEYDEEEVPVRRITDTLYTIDGRAEPEDVLPVLGESVPEDSSFGTMSGFVVDLLGRIPEPHENPSVQWHNMKFTVLVMEDNWISKIKAELLPESDITAEVKT